MRDPLRSISLLLILALTATATADDWPQWRGPQRDGVWREEGIIDRFSGPRLKPRWRMPIASGYSGPTVGQGRVYVTDRLSEPKQIERVHCFNAADGQHIWTHEYACVYRQVGYEAGPRASVLIDGGRAYALGTMGHLLCLDAAKGDLLWGKNLNDLYRIRMPIWGIASSPLVEEDLLIVQIGGVDACLVAFDKRSGAERWKALADRASYSAPIVIEQAGQRVLVCWTGDRIVGLDPQTGQLLWEVSFSPVKMVIAIGSPVFHNDYLFVSGFYDGSMLLRLDRSRLAAKKLWHRRGQNEKSTDSLHSIISTPLLMGDHVYGVDSYGELRCLEMTSGDRVWESDKAVPRGRWSTIHFVRHKENVWMFNERGELIISRLSPQGFTELRRTKLIDPTTAQLSRRGGVCWSHPAFANRHIFARNDQEILCADLGKGD